MKRISLFLLAILACCTANAQFNLQLHYDLGNKIYPDAENGRGQFTATAEFFKADRLGSTYLFVDTDYRGKGENNQGAIAAYLEVGRDFTFAKVKETNSSFTAHVEYNGGLSNSTTYQQAVLVGPAWQWHSNDFSKTFTLQTLYKQFFNQGDLKAHASFQVTPVWGITFAQGLCTFSGFADLWYGYRPFKENKGLVFLTEPQFWFNVVGRDRQNDKFSIGTEWEFSNDFIWGSPTKSFYFNPTVAVKYTF